MFKTFPREIGPPRKVINSKDEFIHYINLYNGKKKAIYTSIYHFEKVDIKPDYNSAVIDKIFLEFDDKSCNAYKECNLLHQYCLKENLKHIILMSGGGYHFYILTEKYKPTNIKSTIFNAQNNFISRLNLHVDKQVIGNPAQLARVPNTFNIRRNRFCIPLTQEQFDKGDEFIKQMAKKQNFVNKIIIGDKLLDLKPFDYKCSTCEEDLTIHDDFEKSSDFSNYKNYLPICIKNILLKRDLGWRERYLVILYFKEIGFTMQETFNVLKDYLSERKLNHCINEERQLQYLYERNELVFPSCKSMFRDGYCKQKCDKFEQIIYKNRIK